MALLPRKQAILETVARSSAIREMWQKYRKQFSYARDLPLETVVSSVQLLLSLLD